MGGGRKGAGWARRLMEQVLVKEFLLQRDTGDQDIFAKVVNRVLGFCFFRVTFVSRPGKPTYEVWSCQPKLRANVLGV